jgi:hypothetical protein
MNGLRSIQHTASLLCHQLVHGLGGGAATLRALRCILDDNARLIRARTRKSRVAGELLSIQPRGSNSTTDHINPQMRIINNSPARQIRTRILMNKKTTRRALSYATRTYELYSPVI